MEVYPTAEQIALLRAFANELPLFYRPKGSLLIRSPLLVTSIENEPIIWEGHFEPGDLAFNLEP